MKSYLICLYAFSFITVFSSCEKLVEVPPPINELVSSSVFTNDPSAVSAVSGMYASLVYASFSSTGFSFNDLSGTMTDELTSHFEEPVFVEFGNNSLATRNESVLGFWSSAYNIIYQANSIIEGLDNNSFVSKSLSDQLSGEALFLRAYSHLFLVSIFGNVPLATTSDYLANNVAERS
ncbi:MAG TPA: RagB/SusD family nutrient uptake outer membrane protein, partial [Pedobacter sp.]|nr:RagB/SusD family nutrient uptake outer membrane protein [Pedobacter sp.]